jgi:hypothetical protein
MQLQGLVEPSPALPAGVVVQKTGWIDTTQAPSSGAGAAARP